jgi:GDP-L-fucose synthase
MDKNSKIYVAGNGLVGSALVRKLIQEGYGNILTATKDRLDLRRQDSVELFFHYHRPEYVFIAAAKVGGINYNKSVPAEFIYDNLMIQSNIIETSFRYGVKKLLFLGSSCIYPKITEQPIKEDYLMNSKLEPTNEGYALAKIAGLRMCEYYTRQYGFNTISLMPANLYGPNDNFNPDKCHVIPGMITKYYNAKKNNEPSIVAWGDGSPKREFLYSDDLADACLFLMKNYNSPDFINVGSDVEISIKDLVEIIRKEIGYTGDVIWDTNLPNGSPRRKMDSQKLFDMGWKPKVSFDEGLARTIKWFKENKV